MERKRGRKIKKTLNIIKKKLKNKPKKRKKKERSKKVNVEEEEEEEEEDDEIEEREKKKENGKVNNNLQISINQRKSLFKKNLNFENFIFSLLIQAIDQLKILSSFMKNKVSPQKAKNEKTTAQEEPMNRKGQEDRGTQMKVNTISITPIRITSIDEGALSQYAVFVSFAFLDFPIHKIKKLLFKK